MGEGEWMKNGWYRKNKRDNDVDDEQELEMEDEKRNGFYRHSKRDEKVGDDALVNEEFMV